MIGLHTVAYVFATYSVGGSQLEGPDTKLTKIGIFYDGGYFHAVSSYYNFVHSRKARLSIDGIRRFVEKKVAAEESVDVRYCRVVDQHYFRGRYSVESVIERNNLENERRGLIGAVIGIALDRVLAKGQ